MPRKTRVEIEQSLLKGGKIPWIDGAKREVLNLATPLQRRLLAFLLNSNVRAVKGLPDTFIAGLAEAFVATDDPASAAPTAGGHSKTAGPWRLARIETEGFGGINIWGGPRFTEEVDEQSLIIDGPNGSGKSSLVAAITWALTGQRPRDGSRGTEEPSGSLVFDSRGAKLGEWPPLACYPTKAGLLATTPFVQVRLTFRNPAGDEAAIDRALRNGQISLSIDPQLELPPVLIETGVMMPTRLAHIRFGAGEQHLTDAVQMLTGLDAIVLLGEFVGELCHKSRDYLGYAKAQRRDEHMCQFTEALSTARNSLTSIGQKMGDFAPADTQNTAGPMAELGKVLAQQATEAVGVISADLSPTLDLTLATVQQQVASAIDAAKTEMSTGLAGLRSWEMISSIASDLSPDASVAVSAAIETARTRLGEALDLNTTAGKDPRFQLKAIAAAWHQQHSSGPVDQCPLCDQSLKDNPKLAAELERVRNAGEAAQRTFRDNLNAIRSDLEATIPASLRRFTGDVISFAPKRELEAELRERFVEAPRYATCLSGLAGDVSVALTATPTQELPEELRTAKNGAPPGVAETLAAIAVAARFLAISDWAAKHQPQWSQWWDGLTGWTHDPVPRNSFAGKLAQLDDAMRASTPYREAAKALRDAWKYGLLIDKIDVEQNRRQSIADELEPLKVLRKFAEAETKDAIEGLSSRMATLLDHIHIVEKLKFHSTHLEKKAGVIVRGGFDPDLRIDASLVANTSWIRALLWSFLFAVREEAVEQMGEDRFPLIVLDDPQVTFDVTHRHRWAQHLAALQATPSCIQVLLATHDESFLAQLATLSVAGRRGYLAAAEEDTGCLSLVEGDALKRCWSDAMLKKTPEAAQAFIAKARVHLETMLKIMLRGEADTRTLTIGKLRDKIQGLNRNRVTPWSRTVFEDLARCLEKRPEILHMESSHHSTGLTLGIGEAIDVEKYWWKEVWPRLDRAFRVIREYRLLHGESKALHAEPSTLTTPPGHRDAVRLIPLEIHGRAAALTDGRLADGNLAFTEFDLPERKRVVLGQHDAYRVVASTLEPVARPGDIVLVAEHAKVLPGCLVLAICSDQLLARRFQVSPEHPDIAILTAQAVNPSLMAPPLIAHTATITLRKIIGVLFDPTAAPISGPLRQELADCGGDAAVKKLVSGTLGLVEVSGQSAEPQALDGQYLLIGPGVAFDIACQVLEGRPVIATDSEGHQYFKRLRVCGSDGVVLESLHGGGDYAPVFLSAPGQGKPAIDRISPVVGVLFERG